MKKATLLMTLMLAVALVAAACGGSADETTTEPTATTASATSAETAPTATPAPEAPEGGESDEGTAPASTVPPRPTATPFPEGVAARVNGEDITMAEFQELLVQAEAFFVQQGVDPESPEGKDRMEGVRTQVLEQLIDQELIEQAAEREGITVTEEQIDSTIADIVSQVGGEDAFEQALKDANLTEEQLRSQVRTQLLSDAVFQQVVGEVSGEAEQIHARHILVETEAEAEEVMSELEAGGDFAELAKEYSQDPTGQQNGGDLGWFPRGVMVPEFEEAAFQLEVGETSGIVETPFGFHIIEVLEKDSARPVPPEMQQSLQQQAFTQWLGEQREAATIERLIETP